MVILTYHYKTDIASASSNISYNLPAQTDLPYRWLLSQGKVDKALSIMKKFERINKTKIPDKVLSDFTVSILSTLLLSNSETLSAGNRES